MREAGRSDGAGHGPRMAAFALTALVTAAAVVLLTRWTADDVRPSAASEASPSTDALVRELHALVAELCEDRLARAAERAAGSQPASDARETSSSPAALVAPPDLQAVIQSLADALRADARSGARGVPLVVPTDDPARRERVFKLAENDEPENTRAHMFWSEQALLDAYGQPDRIEATEGMERWMYSTPGPGGHFVFFTMHGGRVIRTDALR